MMTGRMNTVTIAGPSPAVLLTIHEWSPPSETEMLYKVRVGEVMFSETPSLSHLKVFSGPPRAEQVRVTLSPVLTVVSFGDIVTVPSGETIRRERSLISVLCVGTYGIGLPHRK